MPAASVSQGAGPPQGSARPSLTHTPRFWFLGGGQKRGTWATCIRTLPSGDPRAECKVTAGEAGEEGVSGPHPVGPCVSRRVKAVPRSRRTVAQGSRLRRSVGTLCPPGFCQPACASRTARRGTCKEGDSKSLRQESRANTVLQLPTTLHVPENPPAGGFHP